MCMREGGPFGLPCFKGSDFNVVLSSWGDEVQERVEMHGHFCKGVYLIVALEV